MLLKRASTLPHADDVDQSADIILLLIMIIICRTTTIQTHTLAEKKSSTRHIFNTNGRNLAMKPHHNNIVLYLIIWAERSFQAASIYDRRDFVPKY